MWPFLIHIVLFYDFHDWQTCSHLTLLLLYFVWNQCLAFLYENICGSCPINSMLSKTGTKSFIFEWQCTITESRPSCVSFGVPWPMFREIQIVDKEIRQSYFVFISLLRQQTLLMGITLRVHRNTDDQPFNMMRRICLMHNTHIIITRHVTK